MEPRPWAIFWLNNLWVRFPLLLALLAGVTITFVVYLNRRRTSSCLGAAGFAILLVTNVVTVMLTSFPYFLAGRSAVAFPRAPILSLVIGPLIGLIDAVAIGLLVAALVLDRRSGGGAA